MSVTLESGGNNIVTVHLSGKLHKDDYEHFVPKMEGLIREHGKLRVLLEMHDFHGWDAGALWEDTKFDLKHFADIERLAFVGEKKWEKGMAQFCRPFTKAKIRYFDRSEEAGAEDWIKQ